MSLRLARPTRRAAAAAAALVVVTVAVVVHADPAGAAPPDVVVHTPPVDEPVADPFRPPSTPYGPGNRGLAYELAPGTSVRATADGSVVFAGRVGATQHVSVLHADGLRTTYSFLTTVGVRRGDRIERGEALGTAGPGFHLGARDGDHYLDPESLFGTQVVEVRLVPHGEPLPPADAGLLAEQSALRDLVKAEEPGFLRRLAGAAVRHGAPIVGRFADTVEAAWHSWDGLSPVEVAAGVVESIVRHVGQECSPAAVLPARPAGERIALLVAGLGSSSDHGAVDDVDLDALGYDAAEVLRYRYGGGRTSGGAGLHPALATIPEGAYEPADTLGDVTERGRELADLIEQTAAARPGATVDVYAHSLGGIVTRVALLELADRAAGGRSEAIDALGQVATLGSPHGGADLATLAVLSERGFGQDVAHIRSILDIPIDPYSPAVRQLAETSDLIHRLAREGVPEGIELRTVAARGDLIVTADKAQVQDAPSAITGLSGPRAHAALPGDPATTRELQLGLAGLPPACQGFGDAVLDAVVPEVVGGITDAAGLGTLLVS